MRVLAGTCKSFASGLVFLIFTFSFLVPSVGMAHQLVRVSLPNSPYLVFQDSNGNPKGLYIDILEYIAKKEKWDIRYVPCTFNECIKGLSNGEIDIGLAIGFSEAREVNLDFSSVPVFNNWAHIFKPKGSDINSIKDLEGKNIAIARDDPHLKTLYELAENSDSRIYPVEVEGYLEVISTIEEGAVSAGVIDRANGLLIEEQYSSIERTSIMLNSVWLYFSSKKGREGEMLLTIDRYMTEMRNDTESIYHTSLDSWFVHHRKDRLNPWMTTALIILLFMTVFFFYRIHMLRKRIRRSSLDSEQKLPYDPLRSYRIMFSSAKNFIALIDRDLIYRDVNDMYMQSFRLDREEIVGHPVKDIIGAEVFEEYLKEKLLMCLEGQEVNYEYWLDLPTKGRTCLNVSLSPYPQSVGRVEGIVSTSYDITEKKKMQKEKDLNESRLNALYELSNLVDLKESDLVASALEKAIELTGSSMAYIGRINDDEDVMTVYAWSRDVMKACDVENRTLDFPLKGSGIWAEAIRQRRTLIVNDYEAPNPLKNGLPEGHVSIKSFLSVPIFEGNKIVMMVSVGNKEEAYDDSDARQLSMMMEGIWVHMRRKRSKRALEKSEETYRSLISNIYGGFALHEIVLDENGSPVDYTFLQVNESFEELARLKKEDVIGKRVTEVIPGIRESRFDWIGTYGRVALTGEGIKFEHFFEPLGRWYSISAYSPMQNHFATIFSDITERKQEQQALTKWGNVFEHADWGIVIGSADNRTFETMNQAYAKMHGYTVEELTGQPIINIFAPGYQEDVPEHIRIANEKGHHYFESMHIRKDGTVFPVSMDVTAIKNDEGKVLYRAVSVHDITERVQAEKILMESEEKFKKAFHGGSHIMTITDIETGRFLDVNDNFVKIAGYSREQAIGNTSIEIGWVSREDRDAFKHEMKTKGRVKDMELNVRAEDGRTITCLTSMDIITVRGKSRLLTTAEDITKRKQIEETLKVQGEILQNIAEGVMMSRTSDGIIVYATATFERLFGYGPGELIGSHVSVLNASDEKTAMNIFNEVVRILDEHGAWKGEVFNAKADGTTFWSSAHVSAFEHTEYGNVWVSVQGDITGRKETGKALMESEAKLRSIAETSPDYIMNLDKEGKILFINRTAPDIKVDEVIGTNAYDFIDADNNAIMKACVEGVLESGLQDTYVISRTLPDGQVMYVESRVGPVKNPSGEVVGVTINASDITERRHAEEALRDSEETARILLSTPSSAAMMLDIEGRLLDLNETMLKWLGKDAGNPIGKFIWDFLSPELLKSRKHTVEKVIATATPATFVDERNGIWSEHYVSPVIDSDGSVIKLAIMAYDITEIKNAEIEKEKLVLELQNALDNVKTLSGLLPVCPSCRSVKNDEGLWGKIEEYISSHSDIKVSMDLCPDCSKNLYPEKESSDVNITPLSKREKEVMYWISHGKGTWDIAQLLNIKESTIKFHVSNILRKLDVSSRPQAVAIAMELKLLDNLQPISKSDQPTSQHAKEL